MTWPDLIFKVLTWFGTKLVAVAAILVLFIVIVVVVFKKHKIFEKVRDWLFGPVMKNLEENKNELTKSIDNVHSELVSSSFSRLRRELIMDVAFIESSVRGGTWTENMFQNYAHMLGEYTRLSSEYELSDGEVITSLRKVDKLYAETHDDTLLFGSELITEVQSLLIGK